MRYLGMTVATAVTLTVSLCVWVPTPASAIDLLHNSTDTGSGTKKWPNGWGIAGGKYGQFTCETCHEPNNKSNIKNIRKTISTMNGENWPNGSPQVQVVLRNVTSMGDDSQAHAASNRICEVCHSQNRFHNFNTANNTGGLGHPNPKTRCTQCHSHNTGFKAACGGCHGNPPTTATLGGDTGMVGTPRPSNALQPGQAGAHVTHVQTRSMVCDTCHFINNGGMKMPNQSGSIQIGFFGFGGKVTNGTYVPYTSATRGFPFASGTPGTTIAAGSTNYATANRCMNVYCHGGGSVDNGKAPLSAGLNQTPNWDGVNQNACGNCHGASAANPPTMGSHQKHAGSATGYSYVCDTCHPGTDISHVQGNVRWQFSGTDPRVSSAGYKAFGSVTTVHVGSTGNLAPSSSYGQCSNVYCHYSNNPTWGAQLPLDCTGCHGNNAASATPMAKNAHKAHVNNQSARFNGFNFKCNECHMQVVDNSSRAIANRSLHSNNQKNVDWATLPTQGTTVAYNGTGASCATTYCHSDGRGGAPNITPANWTAVANGTEGTFQCNSCHGGIAGQPNSMSTYRHNNHITTSPAGAILHKGITCDKCHDITVGPDGQSIDAATGYHINKTRDVTFAKFANRSGVYTSGGMTCRSTYCHGRSNPTWTTTTLNACGSCHRASNTTNQQLSNAHLKHYNTSTTPSSTTNEGWTNVNRSSTTNVFMCGVCHAVDPNTQHINGPAMPNGAAAEVVINLPFSVPAGAERPNTVTRGTTVVSDGSNYYYSQETSCDVYCHSNGRGGPPVQVMRWDNSTTTCGNCHNKAGDANPTWSGAHTKHLTSPVSTAATCNACHAATASANNTLITGRRDRHPNGFRNVTGGALAVNLRWNGTNCTNVYCHFNSPTPNWAGGRLSTRCSSCHGSTAVSGTPMTKNAHKAHVANTSPKFNNFNWGCRECHAQVVYANNTSIASTSLHVNGTPNVDWGTLATTTGTLAYNAGACNAVYCHSNGRGNFSPPTNWRSVADGTQGTVSCDYCHRGVLGDFKVMSSARHNNHVQQSPSTGIRHAAVGCDKCHDLTVGPDGKSINAASSMHLSKTIDISFFKFSNRSGSWDGSSNKRCSVTYCHGGSNPRWTTTTVNTCGSCHAASNSGTRALSTTHTKHYNSGTAVTNTNGWDNSNISTNTNAIFRCGVCHNVYPETDHVSGPVTQNGAAAQIVFNIPQVPPGASRPNTFTYGTGQNFDGGGYIYSTGTTCDVYCHSDGRGGASKVSFNWTATTFTCGYCHNSQGDGDANPTWSAPHTKHIRTYAEGGNTNFGCNVCHNSTATNSTTIKSKRYHINGYRNISTNTWAGGTWNGTSCNSVYCHSDGKATPNYVPPTWTSITGNCAGCHGNSTTANPNSVTLSTKHDKHINSATYGMKCANCHSKTVSLTDNLALKNYTGVKYHVNKTRDVLLLSTYGGSWTSPSCASVYCHSDGKSSPTYVNPNWSTLTSSCTTCHDTKQTGGTATTLSGKHNNHMNPTSNVSIGTGNGFDCKDCHAQTVSNNTTISDYSKHTVNKFVDFSSTRGGGSNRYSTSTKVCNNIYCHSNGNPGSLVYVNMTGSKTWTGAATLGCNGCHGRSNSLGVPDYTSGGGIPSTTANSHSIHVAGASGTTICSTCHVKTADKVVAGRFKDYTAVKYHLNRTPNVYFDAAKVGASASFSQGGGTCSNTNCHGTTSPIWGANTGGVSCQKCHGYRNSSWTSLTGGTGTGDSKVGTHFAHISSSGTKKYSRTFTCLECHAGSIALTTDNVNTAGHYDTAPPAELTFGSLSPSGAYNSPSAGQCSTVYCHGAGLASNTSNPPSSRVASPTWNSPFLTGTPGTVGDGATTPGTGDCSTCHGYPPMTSTHAGKVATDCVGCHSHVNSAGTGFTDPTKHVNGTVDGGACNSCHDFDVVGSTYSGGKWRGGAWGKNSKDGLAVNEGWGAHAKHINYIKNRLGIATVLSPNGQSFGAGDAANVCGTCHTNNASNHTTAGSTTGRQINFGDGTFKFGGSGGTSILFGASNPVYNGAPGVTSLTTQKTCSNISCHYFTTPVWSTY